MNCENFRVLMKINQSKGVLSKGELETFMSILKCSPKKYLLTNLIWRKNPISSSHIEKDFQVHQKKFFKPNESVLLAAKHLKPQPKNF